MNKSKSVLMIAPYFVPRRRVGAVRPFRFAVNLPKYGYRPVVMTIGHKPAQLTSAECELLSDIPVISIETGIDRTETVKRSDDVNQRDRGLSITDRVTQFIDRQTPIDTWTYLFLSRWRWIRSEALRVNPDLVWATGDPWSGLWLGKKLSKVLKKPFVADFRDPWTLANVGLRKRSQLSGWVDRKAEKSVIQSSDFLVFTSEATRSLYSDQYHLSSDHSSTIYNTFDPIHRVEEAYLNETPSKKNSDVIQIHFFGRFRRLSPVQPIVEILNRLKEQKPELAAKICIHSYGVPEAEQLQLIDRAELSSQFIFEDVVTPEEAQIALRPADLLLLSTNPSRDSIIPAKLWDYMVTGKPILSIVPNPEVEKILGSIESGIHFTPVNGLSPEEYLSNFVISESKGENSSLPDSLVKKLESQHSAESRTKSLAGILDRLIAANR